jgi:hypothetical protein
VHNTPPGCDELGNPIDRHAAEALARTDRLDGVCPTQANHAVRDAKSDLTSRGPLTSHSLPTSCPTTRNAAKDLGVLNMARALFPFCVAPAVARAVLAIGHRSYGVLYAATGVCAIIGAAAILPVKRG